MISHDLSPEAELIDAACDSDWEMVKVYLADPQWFTEYDLKSLRTILSNLANYISTEIQSRIEKDENNW